MTRFERSDLLQILPRRAAFDLILCRNTVIYFAAPCATICTRGWPTRCGRGVIWWSGRPSESPSGGPGPGAGPAVLLPEGVMDTSEYMPMFLAEAQEQLESLNLAVVRLEANPADRDTVDEIFRMAHSIKGMSATMGFARLAELTHAMEDVFELLRQRRAGISRDAIDTLLACVDALSAAIESVAVTGAEDLDPAALVAPAALSGVGPHARAGALVAPAAVAAPDLRAARRGREARPARGGDAVRRRADARRARAHGARCAGRARRAARLRAGGRRGGAVPRTADRSVAAQRARGGCGPRQAARRSPTWRGPRLTRSTRPADRRRRRPGRGRPRR